MPRSPMRDAICQLLREGKSYNAIAREFDCAKAGRHLYRREGRRTDPDRPFFRPLGSVLPVY